MNILNVSGQNFLTLGEFSINLSERGLLLIQGENKDDPSADSNGAGKSSLPDAISWALYGTTARGISGDAVINRKAAKNCVVSVMVQDGTTEYKISRGRAPNCLFVHSYVPTPSGIEDANLTKGTQAETQEVINRIMGCSLEVFNAAVYAGQENMPDLPGMTDKQLKLLIEEAAGVEVLAEAYKIATTACNEVDKRARVMTGVVDVAEAKALSLKDNIRNYDTETARFNATIATELAELAAESAKLVSQIKAAVGEIARCAVNPADTKSAIDSFEAESKRKKADLEHGLRRAIGENSRCEAILRVLDQDAAKAKRAVEVLQAELSRVKLRVGTPCGECGKPIEAVDLEKLTESYQTKLTAAQAHLAGVLSQDRSPTEKEAKAAALEVKRINEEIAKVGDVSAYAALVKDLRDYESLVTTKVELLAKAATVTARTRELRATVSPYEKLKTKAEAELEEKLEDVATSKKALAEALDEQNMLSEAAKVFGQAGVRAHILDTVTPFLNARTSEYLGTMTDGNIHATWNTLQKTAKGELRERFNIEVTNDKGAESFAGMSGGEKRKVRLATTMALQDMVASRAEKPLNIWIADEIDNALDESGLERLMTVLEQKARERGTVLVISHNSLSDWISEVITVTKKGGISTLAGPLTSV